MALSIKISSFVSGGYTGDVIRWDLIETGTGILIDSHTEPGPHGVVYNFSFVNNIIDVIYTVEMYDVPPGGSIGNLIKAHDLSVSTSTLIMDADIPLIVDGGEVYDPVNGADNVTIAQLIGKTGGDFYVMQRGVGQLLYERIPEYTFDTLTGLITLLGGQKFATYDVWIIKMRPIYVVNPPGSQSASGIFKDIIIATTDTTILSSDFGKLLIAEAGVPVITIQLPLIANIVEKVPLWIESLGTRTAETDTNHINIIFKAATGELMNGLGKTKNRFILGRGEKGQIIRLGLKLYFFTDSIDIKRVGQLEFGYAVTANRLWANGLELVTADYPRIKDAMDDMQVGTVISYATYAASQVINGVTVFPNKGKFAISNDGTHFKLPDLRNSSVRFLRYSDGTTDTERITQGAGGYQHFEIQSHDHPFVVKQGDDNNGLFYDDSSSHKLPDVIYRTGFTGGIETRQLNNAQIPLIIN